MDAVTPASRGCFYQPSHVNARLDGVITGDESHVSAAHDEQILAGADEVAIDQCLESARAVDSREGIAWECQTAFTRAGSDEQHPRLH